MLLPRLLRLSVEDNSIAKPKIAVRIVTSFIFVPCYGYGLNSSIGPPVGFFSGIRGAGGVDGLQQYELGRTGAGSKQACNFSRARNSGVWPGPWQRRSESARVGDRARPGIETVVRTRPGSWCCRRDGVL